MRVGFGRKVANLQCATEARLLLRECDQDVYQMMQKEVLPPGNGNGFTIQASPDTCYEVRGKIVNLVSSIKCLFLVLCRIVDQWGKWRIQREIFRSRPHLDEAKWRKMKRIRVKCNLIHEIRTFFPFPAEGQVPKRLPKPKNDLGHAHQTHSGEQAHRSTLITVMNWSD